MVAPSTTGPNYYLIRTRSGCNDAVLDAPLDTVASIFLSVTDNVTTADLSWNALATPNLSSSNPNYDVWRLEPGGVWTLIGSTPNLFYSDPVIWCQDEVITYRIELGDNLGCTSVSNEVSETLNNPTQPNPQPIDSVTVDPMSGLATICWPMSTSPNVVAYNVYWNPNQFAWNPLDTIPGINNLCWTDSNPAAQNGPIWYQVTATNNCDLEGPPWGSGVDGTDYHETMWLRGTADGCARTVVLEWNKYRYWPEGIKEYQIYVSKNGAPEIRIGSTPDSVTQFLHEDLEDEATYCYLVRALKDVPNRVTSTSNDTCFDIYIPNRPEYDYNYNTTVQPGNTGVEEYFFCDSTAGYLGFEVQRGRDPLSLNTIWFVPFDATTRYYQYTDPGATPQFRSYYYAIIGVDSCDLQADTMNLSRTIYLEAEANSDRTNSLQWNAYEGWLGGVGAYNIYRSIDGPFQYLNSVPSGQLTYLDSIQEIIIGEGKFCYYVEAVQQPGSFVGPVVAPPEPEFFQELSRSNEDCAKQHPNVFMPNAFMPEGINNVFKPVTVYVEADTYLFQIYNRWGQKLFETNNPNEGWNGTHGGKNDPQGVYVYYIQFVSSDGQTYSKSGSVTLIR
jgi:gliding motility-associated-like protein